MIFVYKDAACMMDEPVVKKRQVEVVVKRTPLAKDMQPIPLNYADIKMAWLELLHQHGLSEIDITKPPYAIKAELLVAKMLMHQARITLNHLQHHYPKCFNVHQPKPLKVGILYELMKARRSHQRTFIQCRQALMYYTHGKAYLAEMTADAGRINLQGETVGKVTETHAEKAKVRLAHYRTQDGLDIQDFITYHIKRLKPTHHCQKSKSKKKKSLNQPKSQYLYHESKENQNTSLSQ